MRRIAAASELEIPGGRAAFKPRGPDGRDEAPQAAVGSGTCHVGTFGTG